MIIGQDTISDSLHQWSCAGEQEVEQRTWWSESHTIQVVVELRQHGDQAATVTQDHVGHRQHQHRHRGALHHRLLGLPLWARKSSSWCWQHLWPCPHLFHQRIWYLRVTKVVFCQSNIFQSVNIFRPWRVLHVYHAQLFCLVYVISNFAYIEGGGTNISDRPYIYSILDWRQPRVWDFKSIILSWTLHVHPRSGNVYNHLIWMFV